MEGELMEPFDSIDVAVAALSSARIAAVVQANRFAELQSQFDDLQARYDALVNPPPPPPPPPPVPVNPSGEAMPTADLPGWRLAWSEDFNKDAPEGKIRDVYGHKMMFYPPNPTTAYYPDSKKRGRYETNNLSAEGGTLRYRVHTTPDGLHHVGAIIPTLSDLGQYGAVSAGRFAVRWRSAKLPTYKVAWLLWPNDGDWPKNGEIDFPECSLSGAATIKGFMHRQDAVPGPNAGQDQDNVSTGAFPFNWHTCVIEWKAGTFCRFYLDGKLIKSITARVPKTPMRWTLQTETTLDTSVAIDNNAAGDVEIDWLAYWSPA